MQRKCPRCAGLTRNGRRNDRVVAQWAETLRSQDETGMGYTVCTVGLKDGRAFERVVIVGGTISQCGGEEAIPFTGDEKGWIKATHDKGGPSGFKLTQCRRLRSAPSSRWC